MRTIYKLPIRWLLLALAMAWGGVAWAQAGNLAKIDPELQELMHQSRDANETFRVIIEMAEQYDNPNLERGTAMMTRAQRRDYVVNELKHFSESSQAEVVNYLTAQSTRGQVNVLHRFWIFNGVCCEATANCIGELSTRQDVRFVSLDKEQQMIDPIEATQGRGNPPQSGVQWHVNKIRADFVWSLGYTGQGVVVAVIDTGVNYEHEAMSGKMWNGGEQYPHHGWDFYYNDNNPKDYGGHGSHVAGIVSGESSNYKSGVAPGATIMALKVFGDNPSEEHGPSIDMLCQAVEFAVEHGADVISISIGWREGGYAVFRNTFVNVLNTGVVATVSAGNDGDELSQYPVPFNVGAPGNCPPPWHNPDQVSMGGASAVICVGATNRNDNLANYSSIGPVTWSQGENIGTYNDYPYNPNYSWSGLIRPDVVAPGGEESENPTDLVWSLQHDNNYGYVGKQGTSMATPCVAGVIALMLEVNPYLTPAKIDSILETTAKTCNGQTEKNNYYGAGRVDAFSAVTAAHNTNMPVSYHIGAAKFPERDCYEVGGAGYYSYGSTCTLLASPSNHFLGWEKDGVIVSTDPNYSFVVGLNGLYGVGYDEQYIGVFDDVCKEITLTYDPPEASYYYGYLDYMTGATCSLAITANEGYAFDCLTLNGAVVSRSPDTTFVVTEDLNFVAHFRHWCNITTEAYPAAGGTVSGGGSYLSGDLCTVTATPNVGCAFIGWYNSSMWSFPYSHQPEYTFTVTQDRTLVARFAPRDYTITLNASPTAGGTISGDGTYPSGSVVTVSAHANSGYRFNGWVENGEVVATSNNYMFNANADRNLTATFVSTQSGIGSVVTNADGSRGVLYHFDASGVGWMVAMDEASEGCQWGPTTNVQLLPDRTCDNVVALEDVSGFMNTGLIRTELGTENDYAASQVDFDHGWYLPSAGQLRKLYSALPFIDSVLYHHGGSTISEDTYWSSTEYSSSDAATPMFAMSNSSKSSNRRVRAIRNYYSPQDNTILAMPDSPTRGEVMNYHNGVYSYGENAAVVATPKPGYLFDHWSEEGLPVSYNRNYSFTFTHSRRLVAHFVVSGGIGTVVHNADGSDGVVFYMNTDGTEGLMVALEDASEGCQWGTNSNIIPLNDRPLNGVSALEDVSGFHNTGLIRTAQNADSTVYAAGVVDYENGWYLPAAGELRKLYAALPLIETALVRAGGSTLTEGTYWSSTEYSTSDASTPMFSMGNTAKTSTCRVRAIRKFLPSGIHSLVAKSQDTIMGTASGSGTYDYNATVTVSAVANEGFVFESWTEDGMVVSYDATYQFPFTRNRVLVANFRVAGTVGEIVHNADGSTGVVFYQNAEGTEGWMVALEDASEGCQWGPTTNINAMPDMLYNDIRALEDVSGYRNTDIIRKVLGTNNNYAASVVDFDNGWYLPAAGQLRKLYAALPMIEESILNAGGTLLTEDAYWSSSEYNTSDAFSPLFAMSNVSKTSSRRVRAIRTFNCSNTNVVRVMANNVAFGSVAGRGNYEIGASVSVLATPKPNYAFDHWEEDGCTVSYDRYYTFEFTRTRTLVAVFVRENSIGSIVHNADGSKGVIFYTYPSGIGGLMVALEDVSEGCPWGLNEDITIMDNQSPSAVIDLLNDMCGKSNTNRVRQWYSDNPEYAACKTDYANGWYLPSAGQLRKLYAALPIIEGAIVNAGGTTLTEDAYWSSTEQSASNAWTPSFAMSSSSKTGNCRVRAIRSLTDTETITANVNIEGGGTVKGAGWYDHGQTCTMKAQANESYAFLNWTHGSTVVSTNMEYSFTVLGNQTYTANFVANSSNIITAIEPANSGTVTGAGIYTIGSNCTLTATPHTGYSFVNWTKNGSVVSTNSSYSFTVAESAQYTAHFVINSYAVNATAFPEEGGTVSGAHAYTHGSTATLMATAAEGYTFVNWTENGAVVSTSPALQFVVYGNRTLVANFSDNAYTVTTIAYPSNGGTIEGGGVYIHGTTATLTAYANPQFDFFCWFEGDDIVSFDPTISFEVTENVVLYAVFVEGTTALTKEINAYTEDGGYYLLAVPLEEVDPEEVEFMLDNNYDLYEFDEAQELEWRNHKVDAFNLQWGKGYLYANSEDVTLTFTGIPYSGNGTVTLRKTGNTEMAGWNLVGNPYNQTAYLNRDFYVMKADGSGIIAAQRNYVEPMEGVFVVASTDGETVTFTQTESAKNDARIVLNLSQGLGTTIIDRAIVHFGEGCGLPKFQFMEDGAKLFIQQDGKNYAVVWTDGVGELPVCFKAGESGDYVLNFSIEGMDFSYLHLVDILNNVDIDLLQQSSYTFRVSGQVNEMQFRLIYNLDGEGNQ